MLSPDQMKPYVQNLLTRARTFPPGDPERERLISLAKLIIDTVEEWASQDDLILLASQVQSLEDEALPGSESIGTSPIQEKIPPSPAASPPRKASSESLKDLETGQPRPI